MRFVLTEGFVIALLSGAGALTVAWWTGSLLRAVAIPIEQPQYVSLVPDAGVVAFVAGLMLLAGVGPGFWSGFRSPRDARSLPPPPGHAR